MLNLIKVEKEERSKLDNLLQMYLHNISLYFPIAFNSEEGKYCYDDISKYFDNPANDAYFFKEDNDIVGFAFVDKVEEGYCVQEFFIMNNYKRNGFGKKFAYKIFDKHNSNWVIKSLPKSPVAEQFWEKIIKDYTNNNYEKELVGWYNRAEFRFNNK